MHACMYVCMYVCMYAPMYVCMHLCVHVCSKLYIPNMSWPKFIVSFSSNMPYIQTYIPMHIHIDIDIHIDTYIHIYTYAYTHRHTPVVADAFEYMRTAVSQGKEFDIVIVDPPSMANKASLRTVAIRRRVCIMHEMTYACLYVYVYVSICTCHR